MKLRFLWPRSSADADFGEAIDRYFNRIKHFFPAELIELAPERGGQKSDDLAMMRGQSARLVGAIPEKGHVAVLDERGQLFDSLKFAKWLERLTIDSPHGVIFVVGGDAGFDDSVRKR